MSDFRVPVKSWLRGPTYRALVDQAHARGLEDVGSLLSQLADEVAKGATLKAHRKWSRLTDDKKRDIDNLAAQGVSQAKIAHLVGAGHGTVNRYLQSRRP
jgi:hypothetical protein